MNARELHNWLKDDPQGAETYYQLPSHEARSTILRALRLLAAAEANDGTTPETDAELAKAKVVMKNDGYSYVEQWSGLVSGNFARRMERERNGLAARVGELEPDAERYRWLRVHSWLDSDEFGSPQIVFGAGYNQTAPEALDAAIDSARSKSWHQSSCVNGSQTSSKP